MRSRNIVLMHSRAPGDVVVMTALVRDIMRAHPGKFRLDVETSAMDLWKGNPYLVDLKTIRQKDVEYIQCNYGAGLRDQNHETVHFLSYFHRDFARQAHVKVPLTEPKPDLHLLPEEHARLVAGRYWVFLSGGKSDFTAKVWDFRNWAKVVELLQAQGIRLVQLGSLDTGHWHPEIPGVLNLVGRTNLRDMMRLIHQADGVICGVTCAMHMAAALERPCVVLAGGREAWWWEAYVRENRGLGGPAIAETLKAPHRFLHTIGLLDCCREHGCWKNKVMPLHNDKSLCKHPVIKPGQPIPKCLDMITPAHVVEAVLSYYTDNTLPPIKSPAEIQLPAGIYTAPAAPQAAPSQRSIYTTLPGLFVDPFADPGESLQIPGESPVIPRLLPGDSPATPALLPDAKLHGRQIKAGAQAMLAGTQIFDNPIIGGQFTIFVLLYGHSGYYTMHRRCIDSIIATVPDGRMDLRIGSNALCKESAEYVERLVGDGLVSKHYKHEHNDKKYPVMREMFYDPAHPIMTPWLLWFDDDSIADRNPQWLTVLGRKIIQERPKNNHMFGAKFIWTLKHGQADWYRSRRWHRGKPFRMENGRPSPNGNKIIFATGGFWALSTEAMRACDIPDPELGHNGGDYTIGEQLYQGGFNLSAWNGGKQFVNTSSVPRRGLNESHVGVLPRPRPEGIRVG